MAKLSKKRQDQYLKTLKLVVNMKDKLAIMQTSLHNLGRRRKESQRTGSCDNQAEVAF
jgi:hypothetical protein